MRFRSSRDEPEIETAVRLKLLMEDVSDALDADACAAAIRAGVKVWRFLPTCAEIVEQAQDFLKARRQRHRDERETQNAVEQRRLPPTDYVDPADTDAILAETYRRLDDGHRRMTGKPMPGILRPAVPSDERPLRVPTDAELADVARDLKARWAA